MNIVIAVLLLFWGCIFSIAGLGNIFDLINNVTQRHFRFSTGNYVLAAKVVSKFTSSRRIIMTLFLIIICLELISAFSYVFAWLFYVMGRKSFVAYATVIGMIFPGSLTIGNEVFAYYENEEEHIVLLLAQFVTYVGYILIG